VCVREKRKESGEKDNDLDNHFEEFYNKGQRREER